MDMELETAESELQWTILAYHSRINRIQSLLASDHAKKLHSAERRTLVAHLQQEKEQIRNAISSDYEKHKTDFRKNATRMQKRKELCELYNRTKKKNLAEEVRKQKQMDRDFNIAKSKLEKLHSELALKSSNIRKELKDSFETHHRELDKSLKVLSEIL